MAFSRRETALLVIGDFCSLVLALWLALLLRNLAIPTTGYFLEIVGPFVPIFLLSLVIFFIGGLYEKRTKLVRSAMGTRILGAQGANTIIAATIFFLLPLSIAPKTILVLYLITSVVLVSIFRFYATPALSAHHPKKAVLIGTGAAVDELYEEVKGNKSYGLYFAERIDTAAGNTLSEARSFAERGIEAFVVDTRDPRVARELPALYEAFLSNAALIDFSSFYEDVFDRVPVDHVDYAWLVDILPKRRVFYDAGKRIFDFLFAAVLSVISLLFIIPAILVLMLLGGSPLIYHERIGKGEKRFRIVKLRTMLFNDHGDPELQKKNRVTAFGHFLRKTRIDELPQLWNILLGDLSFIGPRPELPAIAAVYEREVPYYRARHLIAPGLSGWAQIRDYDAPRGAADVERTRRKLSYDLYYLARRSWGLDIAIVLKTLRTLAALSGT